MNLHCTLYISFASSKSLNATFLRVRFIPNNEPTVYTKLTNIPTKCYTYVIPRNQCSRTYGCISKEELIFVVFNKNHEDILEQVLTKETQYTCLIYLMFS